MNKLTSQQLATFKVDVEANPLKLFFLSSCVELPVILSNCEIARI